MNRALTIPAMFALCLAGGAMAGTNIEQNPEDFMQIHMIEITFHEAGTTKNLDLMLSLFADDATITAGGKTYSGKDQIRRYWQAAGPFPASKPMGRLYPGISDQVQRTRR